MSLSKIAQPGQENAFETIHCLLYGDFYKYGFHMSLFSLILKD